MRFSFWGIFCVSLFVLVRSEDYLRTTYETEETLKKWVKGVADSGELTLKSRKYDLDEDKKALFTGQPSKFYHYSQKLVKPAQVKDKDFVVQYVLHHEDGCDCGGGYVKLLPDFDQSKFNGETNYSIMFGPDKCGATERIHLIFNVEGRNILRTQDININMNEHPHIFTLTITKDKKYVVKMDCKEVASGNIIDDWKINPDKTIKDPNDVKPKDWVDEEDIPDPDDKKPDDWDKPETIEDPNAKQPEDWDEDTDGEWKIPQIDNPDYKGPWSPKMIKNPDFKGEWVQKEIPNPDYKEVESYVDYSDISILGIDVWQVKARSLFSHFLVSDDVEAADSVCQEELKELQDYTVIQEKELKKELEAKAEQNAQPAELDEEEEVDQEDNKAEEKDEL